MGSDFETLLVRRYSFASDVAPALVRFSTGMIAATRFEVISDFLPTFAGHDKRDALAAMADAEVLVLVGDHDLLIPAAHSEEIARRLPAAEHVLVRHGGHLVLLEHPQIVDAHVLDLAERAAQVAARIAPRVSSHGVGTTYRDARTSAPARAARAPAERDRDSDRCAPCRPDGRGGAADGLAGRLRAHGRRDAEPRGGVSAPSCGPATSSSSPATSAPARPR